MSIHNSRFPQNLSSLHRSWIHLNHNPQQWRIHKLQSLTQPIQEIRLKCTIIRRCHHNQLRLRYWNKTQIHFRRRLDRQINRINHRILSPNLTMTIFLKLHIHMRRLDLEGKIMTTNVISIMTKRHHTKQETKQEKHTASKECPSPTIATFPWRSNKESSRDKSPRSNGKRRERRRVFSIRKKLWRWRRSWKRYSVRINPIVIGRRQSPPNRRHQTTKSQ